MKDTTENKNVTNVGICSVCIKDSMTVSELKNMIKSLESKVPDLDNYKVTVNFSNGADGYVRFPLANSIHIDTWRSLDNGNTINTLCLG